MYKTRSRSIQQWADRNGWSSSRANAKVDNSVLLDVGKTYWGYVSKIFEHGAIVEIYGATTYLHVSQIRKNYVSHPSDVLYRDQKVKVKIISKKKVKKGRPSIKVTMRNVNQRPKKMKPKRQAIRKSDHNPKAKNGISVFQRSDTELISA